MNTKTIVSDLGKDVIRLIGDKFSVQARNFLLHYENIGERVSASKDQVASLFYQAARSRMTQIVSHHLEQVLHMQFADENGKNCSYYTDNEWRFGVQDFESNVKMVLQRLKETNQL